jgi:hypothetical protein
LTRGGHSATDAEIARLRELWEAAQVAYDAAIRDSRLRGWYVPARPPDWALLEVEFAPVDEAVAAAAAPPARMETPGKPPDEPGETGGIPFDLVEKAVQRHAETREGRRVIARFVPGLTDWWARLILRWYKVGKPAGLWLEHGRLRWGPAITPVRGREQVRGHREAADSPTPVALRLPRA